LRRWRTLSAALRPTIPSGTTSGRENCLRSADQAAADFLQLETPGEESDVRGRIVVETQFFPITACWSMTARSARARFERKTRPGVSAP